MKQTHLVRGSVVCVCSEKGLDDVILAVLSGDEERGRSGLSKMRRKISEIESVRVHVRLTCV